MAEGAKAARAERRIARAIEALPAGRYLLAVSGGRDSMALLDAFTRFRVDASALATFDHATGAVARRAVLLAAREGEARGLRVLRARRAPGEPATEAAWRDARWAFLRACARSTGSTIVTAHTRDDQLETVVMRVMRDAHHTSARGMAGMYARNRRDPVVRPLLHVTRADLASYAASRCLRFVEDPTNADRAYLRNRVRLDLLPALEYASRGFGATMLRLARDAAAWRSALDEIVEGLGATLLPDGAVVIAADTLRCFDSAALAVLWPALAERAGIVLDRRGTHRLIAFTKRGKPARRIPLSGGAQVERTSRTFVMRACIANE
ncbi:MAG TPA: tRNA lysidine(34) synthetase TilS [Gemmatimonadaceae bacterium]|nr:tRNA lysidine(34) synthetase TilS [Gemmatimonadaceae bacterium]